MKIPAVNLQEQYRMIRPAIDEAIGRVLGHQQFILGKEVERCEKEIATLCGTAFGCGVSSGTDALLLALLAEPIGPGDEVITTPYTFVATAGAIRRAGALPVFADIDPRTYTIDPARVAERLTPHTRAILPVHLFGQMADMTALLSLAEAATCVVIEDAAQSMGASDRNRGAGSVGAYGCLSFFPSKNLGCAGDGGMVLTNDPERDARLRLLRAHGMKQKTEAVVLGGNFRLDALQAAILTAKLPFFHEWIERRRQNAERYTRLFLESGLPEKDLVRLPEELQGRHSWNQYVIRVRERDTVHAALQARGIDSRIYYLLPLHLHRIFADLGYREGDFPVSECAARETLALPLYPELTNAQAEEIVCALSEIVAGHVPVLDY